MTVSRLDHHRFPTCSHCFVITLDFATMDISIHKHRDEMVKVKIMVVFYCCVEQFTM